MAGEAKQGTIVPTQGVTPYSFSKVNVGTATGKLLNKAVQTHVTAKEITAAKQAEAKAGAKKASLDKTIAGLKTIKSTAAQEFPSTPMSSSPKAKAQARSQKGVLSRQMNASTRAPKGSKKPVPQGSTQVTFQEPGAPVTAAGAVAASRKRARSVRPAKETSLSVKRL